MIHVPLLLTLLLAATQVSAGETFTATVTEVTDGDTVHVQAAGRPKIAVRFGEIDAPEMNQRHGKESHQFLAKLVQGKRVRVELSGKKSYERHIGSLFLDDGTNVSVEMVRQGHAWWFWQFADESSEERTKSLAEAERKAKVAQRGIFATKDPIYPRVFRRGGRVPNEVGQSGGVDPILPEVKPKSVAIIAILPNPVGGDAGNEKVAIHNGTDKPVSLEGWKLKDDDGGSFAVGGTLEPGESKVFTLDDSLLLGNSGDVVMLVDTTGTKRQAVRYDAAASGKTINPH